MARSPKPIWDVMNRQKDVQYSSRAASHIKRQRQLHRMRHVVSEIAALVPKEARVANQFSELAAYGCTTRMHVIRLLAPALDHEDHAKDLDFSPEGIRQRREAGYRHHLRDPWSRRLGAGTSIHWRASSCTRPAADSWWRRRQPPNDLRCAGPGAPC